MITAKIIEDSISADNVRLATLQLAYPRLVHSEFMTHRVFSRNASSSRAIPVKKMIEAILENPAMPVSWGANQAGMQAGAEHNELIKIPGHLYVAYRAYKPDADESFLCTREDWWRFGTWLSSFICVGFADAGYHKQIANRQLEHSQHIHVVMTATKFSNFFMLRDHPAADPTIAELALQMKHAMEDSEPTLLHAGEWHLPYVTAIERDSLDIETLCKVSAARCARVSYLKHDGTKASVSEEIELYNQLMTRPFTDKRGFSYGDDDPIHASPVEHQATPDVFSNGEWGKPDLHGNLVGWIQNRKLIERQFCQ